MKGGVAPREPTREQKERREDYQYAVKGGVAPREPTREQEERREDYLQDSGGGYAPDSAESTDADTMYDSQVSSTYSTYVVSKTTYWALFTIIMTLEELTYVD